MSFPRTEDVELLEAEGELQQFYRRMGKSRWFMECSPHASIDYSFLDKSGGQLGGSVIKLVGDIDAGADLPDTSVQVVTATGGDSAAFVDIVGTQLGVPNRTHHPSHSGCTSSRLSLDERGNVT